MRTAGNSHVQAYARWSYGYRYKEQRIKLLEMADDIRAFIRSNESSLKTKS